MFHVAILAGGLATRLYPVTKKIPKALIEVAGAPFIVHQLRLLHRHHIERVVLCVGYLGDMIQDTIGHGEKWGVRVEYCHDGATLLGTGGSLKKALPLLGEAFFVLYGDSYLECDYEDIQSVFIKSGRRGLMTVLKNDNRWGQSNVVYRDGEILEYDKKNAHPAMHYIDYGLSILTGEAFSHTSADVFDLGDIFQSLILQSRMVGYEVRDRFYEIGSRQGLEETRKHLASPPDKKGKKNLSL